jgi:trans-aconitate 2-methyltransferase
MATNSDIMEAEKKVQKWYNAFSEKQLQTGTNLRHYTLFNNLVANGLKKNHSVLEVGCGIGTLTRLIYKYLRKGELVATDISDESINIAKSRIGTSRKIEFLVTDMTDFNHPKKFDFIILPDVLEHIPVEQHKALFQILSKHMHNDSIMIINVPHPRALDFLRIHFPEKLQVIDQSLNASELLNNAYASNLELINYTSYSLFNKEADYVFIKFRKEQMISLTPISKPEIIYRKFFKRIRYYIARLV